VLVGQLVLPLAFLEMLGGVDEEHIIRLLALLQHEDADRNPRRIEQVGGQADHGIDISVLEQLRADAFLRAAPEEHAVRQNDRHHALVLEVVESVQQKREIRRRLGRHSVILEAHILA